MMQRTSAGAVVEADMQWIGKHATNEYIISYGM